MSHSTLIDPLSDNFSLIVLNVVEHCKKNPELGPRDLHLIKMLADLTFEIMKEDQSPLLEFGREAFLNQPYLIKYIGGDYRGVLDEFLQSGRAEHEIERYQALEAGNKEYFAAEFEHLQESISGLRSIFKHAE